MFLSSKVLAKLYGILFLSFTNLVGYIDTDNNKNYFRNRVANKFTPKIPKIKTLLNTGLAKDKIAEIVKLPPSIPACPSKKVLEKSRFFSKGKKPMSMYKTS